MAEYKITKNYISLIKSNECFIVFRYYISSWNIFYKLISCDIIRLKLKRYINFVRIIKKLYL